MVDPAGKGVDVSEEAGACVSTAASGHISADEQAIDDVVLHERVSPVTLSQ